MLLRLPLEVRDLFREWLMANYPDRYRHVFKLIRDMRGGKDYDSTWGKRMKGSGPYAWMIGRRFEMACEKLGLNAAKFSLIDRAFPPAQAGRGAAESVLVFMSFPHSGPASPARAQAPAGTHNPCLSALSTPGLWVPSLPRCHRPPGTTGIPAFHRWPLSPIDIARVARPMIGHGPKPKPTARLPLDEPVLRPSFRRERRALNNGIFPVAGCDEAGRGPLAGPVVAAAVILDPKPHPARARTIPRSSTPPTREKLYEKICATAQVAVAFGAVERIDRDNILRASLWALARAVRALPVRPKLVFVDGNHRIDCGCDCEAVVSGDALVLSIAAASIVAKVTRDRLMGRLGLAHPGYGFERHMGYSVPEHFEALARLGPTIHHRRSFAPVAAKLAALGGACRRGRSAELLPL